MTISHYSMGRRYYKRKADLPLVLSLATWRRPSFLLPIAIQWAIQWALLQTLLSLFHLSTDLSASLFIGLYCRLFLKETADKLCYIIHNSPAAAGLPAAVAPDWIGSESEPDAEDAEWHGPPQLTWGLDRA
jgi:hypothetical protein